MLTVTRIKELMREYGFRPDKRLGQDFLIDKNIADKIIDLAGLGPQDIVLEIGAGLGNITSEIASVARKVIAVEYDRRLFEILKINMAGYGNIDFLHADILGVDFKRYATEGKLKIIGNVPYYITTPIVERILISKAFIKDMVLMVQKEVGERMLAAEGSKTYSPLSCYIQYHTRPKFGSVVKPTSFFPKPKVESAIIYFSVLDKPSVEVKNEKLFFKIVRGAFNQRRKMLLSSLRRKDLLDMDKERLSGILKKAGVDPRVRPEMLSLQDFANISDQLTDSEVF